jgi:DNA-binding SARP family transcriptional activator
MRRALALGRPASALAAYAEVRARLAEDLGVSPAAETEALHSEILLAVRSPRR